MDGRREGGRKEMFWQSTLIVQLELVGVRTSGEKDKGQCTIALLNSPYQAFLSFESHNKQTIKV